MPRDNTIKMIKKNSSKQSKRAEEAKRNRKMNMSSDSGSDSDDSSYHSSDDDEETLDVQEYRKLLSQLYPSKHMQQKIKAGKRLKNILEEEAEDSESNDETNKKLTSKKKQKSSPKKHKSKKHQVSESDNESEEESNDDDETLGSRDTDDDNSSEEEDDDMHKVKNLKGNKLNIIFTIGGHAEDEDDEEYYEEEDIWETTSDNSTENEDDPVSTDSSSSEDDEEEKSSESEEVELKTKKNNRSKKENNKDKTKEKTEKKSKPKTQSSDVDVIDQIKNIVQKAEASSSNEQLPEVNLLDMLKKFHETNKDNEIVTECLRVCEEKMQKKIKKDEKKTKKTKDRNERIFRKIMYDKNSMNDFEFFGKMEIPEQKKIIKELREINKISRIEKPYRITLLQSDIPVVFKNVALKKICNLRQMDPGSGEFYKIKNWVDTFMQIPFGKYKTLPISIGDGVENCHNFMESAQKTLDNAVYGLNDAKMQIMQMLGQFITNPKSIGSAIAIHGPPGTGKTSLVKEGISKILNRPFAFIALGGATDSSFLEGHGYTYEGSTWGKIVQILIDSKCMNPVIYFDELDKISETPKGEEIAGILTHLTDTSQNSQFHDKYFSEIDFDLSKCLFIFSYNDESKVNPILRDRMYRIQTKGYNQKQKTIISKDYLLPKIREQIHFTSDEIIIPDSTIHYIIENHCDKEDGVRNLKRCMEIIHTKLNLYRLMKPGTNLFEEDMSLAVTFPFTVTKDIVDKLIKDKKEINTAMSYLYV